MSNPGQGGDQPYGNQSYPGDNPYAGPGAYRGPQEPGRYGSSPAYGQQEPYARQEPYAYNPYSDQYPAGTGGDAPRAVARPGLMVLALVLLILSALPFLVAGVALLLVPIDAATITAALPPGQLEAAGFTPENILSVVRVGGGILAALAALYILFAVLAFTGRNWSRIVVAVLTAGFALLILAGLVQGAGGGSGSGFTVAILAASVIGVVLLFVPASRAYFASRRS